MEIANVKEALNLNNKVKAITPHTLGMVLDKVGASGGGSSETTCPYRIGDVLFSTIGDDPKETYPDTTWVRIAEGKYIIGQTDSDSNFNTGGMTGGSWTHSHTMAHTHTLNGHTHTMAHTHTITSHTHKLGDSGYACIYYGGSTFYSREINKSGLFTATSYKSVSGTAGNNTKSHAYATTLGGTTGASSSTPASGAASNATTTGSSVNTSAASNETTSSPSVILPYIVLYAWERIS